MTTDTDDREDPGAFLHKWRLQWPEWAIAAVFLSPATRETTEAWHALQLELLRAAWAGEDPRPGEAKLTWWMDELHGWSQGRRRHPLGTMLQGLDAPWGALGRVLPALAASRERPRDLDEARATLQPAAEAAAAIDAALEAGPANAASVTACWLVTRLALQPAGAVPLSALARGEADAAPRWRHELLASWPRAEGPRSRRLAQSLAEARLRRGDATAAVPAWRVLGPAWRTARD